MRRGAAQLSGRLRPEVAICVIVFCVCWRGRIIPQDQHCISLTRQNHGQSAQGAARLRSRAGPRVSNGRRGAELIEVRIESAEDLAERAREGLSPNSRRAGTRNFRPGKIARTLWEGEINRRVNKAALGRLHSVRCHQAAARLETWRWTQSLGESGKASI